MRITVNCKRAEISTGRDCEPTRWNSHAGRCIGTKEEARTLNTYLDSLQHKVKIAHQQLVDAGQNITAESLRNQFTGETKKIVNHCLANRWLTENPFINYKQTVKVKERTFLTQEELDAIHTNPKITIGRLQNVRDVFVFCCYTGLSYADVKKLKPSEIGIGMDGGKWIFTSRQKTDTSSRIPLLPVALEILNRYQDHP